MQPRLQAGKSEHTGLTSQWMYGKEYDLSDTGRDKGSYHQRKSLKALNDPAFDQNIIGLHEYEVLAMGTERKEYVEGIF